MRITYLLELLRRFFHLRRPKTAPAPTRHSQLPRILIRIYFAVGVLLTLIAVGTIGFYLIGGERANLSDAFYMTLITVTTVGYGEVVPIHSFGERLFAGLIALAGAQASTASCQAGSATTRSMAATTSAMRRTWRAETKAIESENRCGRLSASIACSAPSRGSRARASSRAWRSRETHWQPTLRASAMPAQPPAADPARMVLTSAGADTGLETGERVIGKRFDCSDHFSFNHLP